MNYSRFVAFVVLFSNVQCDGGEELGAPPPDEIASLRQAAFGAGGTDVGNYYQLKSVGSGLCVDVSGRSQANGAPVIQFGCSSGENQRFYFRALSSTDYQLSAKHSAKCLRVTNALVQDPCARSGSGQTGEVFTATRVGTVNPPRYQLVVKSSGQCLQSPSSTSGAALGARPCATSNGFLWTFELSPPPAPSDTNGRWSGVITLPAVPVSAAVLPNLKVITWASWKALRFGGSGSLDQTVTVTFPYDNPGNNVTRTITNTTHNMFCPGTAMLSDGRLLVNGGDDVRTDATSIYNYATDSWTRGAAMHEQRWYNVSVTLPDGRALTLGGNRT
jgi:galactose oxidase